MATIPTTAVFPFNVWVKKEVFTPEIVNRTSTYTYPNHTQLTVTTLERQTVVSYTQENFGNGHITIQGKGGLSADNPLDFSVTAYLPTTPSNSRVTFMPNGAYATESPSIWLPIALNSTGMLLQQFRLPFFPIVEATDKEGSPEGLGILLTFLDGVWLGYGTAIYNQAGNFSATITGGSLSFLLSPSIEISSESVTVTARTNSLLVALTWLIIAFAALEIREHDRSKAKRYN